VKGQKSRRGVSINGFEGGQMPLHMRMPKRGFSPPAQKQMVWINLETLQKAIDNKKIDPSAEITEQRLADAGVIRRKKDGVRLLARGALKAKVNIVVSGASAAAVAAVEKSGGTVKLLNPPADKPAAA
jgi:large subunit ribosomal protein L15